MTYLEVFILAIIEGVTEFLPVSSTGHMVIDSAFMSISKNSLMKKMMDSYKTIQYHSVPILS